MLLARNICGRLCRVLHSPLYGHKAVLVRQIALRPNLVVQQARLTHWLEEKNRRIVARAEAAHSMENQVIEIAEYTTRVRQRGSVSPIHLVTCV